LFVGEPARFIGAVPIQPASIEMNLGPIGHGNQESLVVPVRLGSPVDSPSSIAVRTQEAVIFHAVENPHQAGPGGWPPLFGQPHLDLPGGCAPIRPWLDLLASAVRPTAP
jgi:hypothetical protein